MISTFSLTLRNRIPWQIWTENKKGGREREKDREREKEREVEAERGRETDSQSDKRLKHRFTGKSDSFAR